MFTLAGFNVGTTVPRVKAVKEDLLRQLQQLGGEVVESDIWDSRVTHVITHTDGNRDGLSEKVKKLSFALLTPRPANLASSVLLVQVMAGLAAGRWVVTRRWVEKSARAGCWLSQPRLYTFPRQAVLDSREARHKTGQGPFANWQLQIAFVE